MRPSSPAAIHRGPVDEGRECVELLPGAALAHRRGPHEVEAGGREVHPRVELVPRRNWNREAFRIVGCRIFTAIECIFNRKS